MNKIVTKKCCRCDKDKKTSEFHVDKKHKDGLSSWCKACKKENFAQWRLRNIERLKSYLRTWKNEHPERVREQSRKGNAKWIINNAERHAEQDRKWKKAHPEKRREVVRKYKNEHPEKVQEYDRNRRAWKRIGGGKISAKEWQAIKEKYGNRCLYPGCNRTDVTMDHVVPLSLGGTHTTDNVQPLCLYHNQAKSKKVIDYR